MDIIKFDVQGIIDSSLTDKHNQNTMLNAFRLETSNSLVIFNMVDGIADEYEDESGVDLTFYNESVFDSTNNLYRPDYSFIELLLNLNGTDGATTTTDASSNNRTVTFNGTAQLDTDQSKFGGSSLLLDGNSDYLTLAADSLTWELGEGNNTTNSAFINFWIRHADLTGQQTYLSERFSSTFFWRIYKDSTHHIGFQFQSSGVDRINFVSSSTLSVNTWYNLLLVKIGTGSSKEFGLYLDGTQIGFGSTSTNSQFGQPLNIGRFPDNTDFFNGNMDDIKWSTGNTYSAAPNIGLTDTIAAPTLEHDGNMTLISTNFIAQTQPDNARIVILQEDIDSITLNTDLIVSVSRDGGTTYSTTTLVNSGNYDSNINVLTSEVDISSQPAGTTMKYKIETANIKDLKIHAASLSWS